MTRRPSHVLGVYFGHNASVALARDGAIVFALSEERVRRIKNYTGFPSLAYRMLLDRCLGGDASAIDLVVFPSDSNQEYHFFLHSGRFADGRYFTRYADRESTEVPPFFRTRDAEAFARHVSADTARVAAINADAGLHAAARERFESELGIPARRFRFINHHAAHAYAAGYHVPADEPWLVLTADGSGDNLCATVNTLAGGVLTTLSRTPRYASLGRFYREVTAFLGLEPDQDEFKVMGLAPYADRRRGERVYRKFAPLVQVDRDGGFESLFPMEFTKHFLLEQCVYDRFDEVAGAAQAFLEDRISEWARYWIARTGLRRVAVGGGVFMNCKLNQVLMELPEVERLVPVPSAGDESTVMGCCLAGAGLLSQGEPPVPVRDLDLGPADHDVETLLRKAGAFEEFVVTREADIAPAVAQLLARGEVVGRVSGRAEWGARALGYRSLLADPRQPDVVRRINEAIKGRDFWMPFAPSILEEDFDRYVVNPTGIFAPYMTLTFASSARGRRDLAAAVHPHDFTTRPQAVRATWNPSYHRLIDCFKDLTGVGAVLNTSLNLHGHPNVLTAADALEVLRESSLRYLAVESWLVQKRGAVTGPAPPAAA
jgi:carbamoyltransferase